MSATVNNGMINFKYRHEHRYSPQVFVEVAACDGSSDRVVDALTADLSKNGMALLTYYPFPAGTRVEIRLRDEGKMIGNIVYAEPSDFHDLIRLGVHFIEKQGNWSI